MGNEYIEAKSLCTPSKLPASDYVINPYLGCLHRCIYCYACFMGRFTGQNGKWGTFLYPKKYVTYQLPNRLSGKTILIGSVTDPYTPGENKYKLMPEILKHLETCQAHVEILTKSCLVQRDIELFKRIPDITVGISLSNLNDEDNKLIEPGAASAKERISVLKKLHRSGIRTYVFVSPYLPGITDIRNIYKILQGSIDYICIENLNLRGSYKQPMLDAINKMHPELYNLWNDIFITKKKKEYWISIEHEIEQLKTEIEIPIISYMYHNKIRKSI